MSEEANCGGDKGVENHKGGRSANGTRRSNGGFRQGDGRGAAESSNVEK